MAALTAAERAYARAGKTLRVLFAVALALLATHQGEFWPFSIFPMFSKAGRPFTRSVVRELAPDEAYVAAPHVLATLPGEPFALEPAGIAQNDVAALVSKGGAWTAARVASAEQLFASQRARHRLLLMSAHGVPSGQGVALTFRPVLELSSQPTKVLAP